LVNILRGVELKLIPAIPVKGVGATLASLSFVAALGGGLNAIDSKTMEGQTPDKCGKGQWAIVVPRTHISAPDWMILTHKEDPPNLRDIIAEKHPEYSIKAIIDANPDKKLAAMGSVAPVAGGVQCFNVPSVPGSVSAGKPNTHPIVQNVQGAVAPKALAGLNHWPVVMSDKQIITVAYNAGFRGSGLVTIGAIALAESRGNNMAQCRNSGHGCDAAPGHELSTDVGLFQINDRVWHVSAADMQDPVKCAAVAFRVSHHGVRFRPWVTYWRGYYKKYMNRMSIAARELKVI